MTLDEMKDLRVSRDTMKSSICWISSCGPLTFPSTGCRRQDMLLRLQNGGVSEPMPVNLSIKNAPDKIVERLRRRAERHPQVSPR